MCVDRGPGSRLPLDEETPNGFARLLLDFRIYHPPGSSARSPMLSNLPYRDLWNVSNQTPNP